jgi:hypothetical protein
VATVAAGLLTAAVYVSHGERLVEMQLVSIPVFDGLIAANSRLYLSLKDGSVACLAPSP